MTKEESFVVWRVIDKYGQCVSFGIDDFPIEFDLDQLPDGWSSDRPVDVVQKTMRDNSKLWREEKYTFEYEYHKYDEDLKVK